MKASTLFGLGMALSSLILTGDPSAAMKEITKFVGKKLSGLDLDVIEWMPKMKDLFPHFDHKGISLSSQHL